MNVLDETNLRELMRDGWSWFTRVTGGSYEEPSVYILVDEDGNEYTALPSDEPIDLNATANDIRVGTAAATNTGFTPGEKVIPSYHTEEGYVEVAVGAEMKVFMFSDRHNYTKFQAIICRFNTTSNNSVAADKVSIDGKTYAVSSTVALSDVTVDDDNSAIDLGLINDSDETVVIRYFTYKEVY